MNEKRELTCICSQISSVVSEQNCLDKLTYRFLLLTFFFLKLVVIYEFSVTSICIAIIDYFFNKLS